MNATQYFRAGVGIVPYTSDKQIHVFERTDLPRVWQFPQGGIDAGESIDDALWRELFEETGISKSEVMRITEYPTWLYYEYSPTIRNTLKDVNTIGQMHRWFFIELPVGYEINLKNAKDQEFIASKRTTFKELVSHQEPYDVIKYKVYCELAKFFTTQIP